MDYSYLGVVDKYHDDGVPAYFLNGIQVSQSIHFIETAIPPHARACPASPYVATLLLQFHTPLLSPALQECIIITPAQIRFLVVLAAARNIARPHTCSGT